MIFELLHAPYPEGYGEAILTLQACKEHLRVDGEDDDSLIEALRDASIEFVERYCSVRLRATPGLEWRAAGFPISASVALPLSISPVISIESVTWRDAGGAMVPGVLEDYRITARGDVFPAIGRQWPAGVGGDVSVTFTAGYADGAAPHSLVAAVRLFLGHLYKNREAVTDRGTEAEVPFGVRQLCAPFRRVLI